MTLVQTYGQTNQAGESKLGRINEGMHKKDAKFFDLVFLAIGIAILESKHTQ